MRDRFYYMVASLFFALIPFLTMAATPTASPLSSGIEGVILISPSHPGPIRKDQPDAGPAPNIAFVVMRADERITSVTTDSEGRFRLSLPPGHYTVLRDDPGAKIGHWRFEADVKPSEVTTVHWTADSGMR